MHLGLPNQPIDTHKVSVTATFLKALASPIRLSIIELLRDKGHISMMDIRATIPEEPSLLIHHLNKMRLQGIVGMRKDGRNVSYYLEQQQVLSLIDSVFLLSKANGI